MLLCSLDENVMDEFLDSCDAIADASVQKFISAIWNESLNLKQWLGENGEWTIARFTRACILKSDDQH